MTYSIVAVDQSSSLDVNKTGNNQLGYAIFTDGKLVDFGEFLPDYPSFDKCRRWLEDMVLKLDPTDAYRHKITLAIETVWFGKNVRVFQRLTEIKSHLHAKARELGIGYEEVSPLESYQSVVGRSKYLGTGTRKKEIASVLIPKYNLLPKISDHITDAIAIGEAVINRGV